MSKFVRGDEGEVEASTPLGGGVADVADDPLAGAELHRHPRARVEASPESLHLGAGGGSRGEGKVELEEDARELALGEEGFEGSVETRPEVRLGGLGHVVVSRSSGSRAGRVAVGGEAEDLAGASGEGRDVDGARAEGAERLDDELEARCAGGAPDPTLHGLGRRDGVARGVHLHAAEVLAVHLEPVLRAAARRGVHAEVLVGGTPPARPLDQLPGRVQRAHRGGDREKGCRAVYDADEAEMM